MNATYRPVRTAGRRIYTSRRSVILVLVLVYIVLAGSLMLLTTASVGQLIRTNRSAHHSILLRQLTDSGRAWADARENLPMETPIALDPASMLPAEVSGTVTITLRPDPLPTITIEAELQIHGRAITSTTVSSLYSPMSP